MGIYLVLQVILTLGLLVLIGFVAYALIALQRTLRTFDELLSNINKDLPSVLSKLQITLDGVNSEMDRVEQIVSSFQEVSSSVQNTTGMVRRIVSTPFIKLSGVASGASAAMSRLVRRGQ